MNIRSLSVLFLLCAGCVEMDSFLFEANEVNSIEEDYHGLPLFVGDAPDWINPADAEREIYLRSPSGERLSQPDGDNYIHGVFLRAPTECPLSECPLARSGVTFVFQHGNSGDMFLYWYRAVYLWSTGANVFIYTYRGYGLSRGETTRAHVLEDADTALQYVQSRADVPPDRIFAYGYSMGGIPTSWLAGRSEQRVALRGAVLESALDSPASTANISTGTAWPDGFFLDADTPFDGPEFMKGADLPVLHMHGGDDDRVLRRQAGRYFDVLSKRSDYTAIIGESNNPAEEWMAKANHRNLPHHAFAAAEHISEYYDDDRNPGHCCVHPLELLSPENTDFLQTIGGDDGTAMWESWRDYRDILVTWVQQVIQP